MPPPSPPPHTAHAPLGGVRVIPLGEGATLGDYRRFPGSRLMLVCGLCGWWRTYSASRVIDRLRTLHAGGHASSFAQVARRVSWNCPGCHRVKWRAQLAWPAGIDSREIKRLGDLYRN